MVRICGHTLCARHALRNTGQKPAFSGIGKNVPLSRTVQTDIAGGPCGGNHTQNHLNGWKTDDARYLCRYYRSCSIHLILSYLDRHTVVLPVSSPAGAGAAWPAGGHGSVLSGDFDINLEPRKMLYKCAETRSRRVDNCFP